MLSRFQHIISERVPAMVFMALFALPWINLIHLSTFLFIALGMALLCCGNMKMPYRQLFSQPWVWLFIAYYILNFAAYLRFPHDHFTRASVDQKASLIIIPLLFFILIYHYRNIWKIAISGFIAGCVFAALYCLGTALVHFRQSGNIDVFFYHTYSQAIGMNAIYLSLYLLISFIYVIRLGISRFRAFSTEWWLCTTLALFIYGNLLLLDSKMLIAIGSVYALIFSYQSFHGAVQKIAAYGFFGLCVVMLLAMNNPISKRYRDIQLNSYSAVLDKTDFTNFRFDGFNFRLIMWKLGLQAVQENHGRLAGLGGEHYHETLNNEIRSYKMYTGDGRPNDHGYLDYNLHNQYMESYVQFGLPGALILTAILAWLMVSTFRSGNIIAGLAMVLFALIFLTESGLETQSGILLFTIIISGEWIQQLHSRNYRLTA
jgi:hypothetical protein